MNTRIALGIAGAILLSLTIGCTQGPELVRGQTPVEPVVMTNAAMSGHDCPTCAAGADGYGDGYGYPGGQLPYSHVLNHGPNSGDGRGHHPTHYHWYSYEQPRNLVYPQADQPAAVIQYPYYTVKGPTDFFMK